jgi:hypothetical protein
MVIIPIRKYVTFHCDIDESGTYHLGDYFCHTKSNAMLFFETAASGVHVGGVSIYIYIYTNIYIYRERERDRHTYSYTSLDCRVAV